MACDFYLYAIPDTYGKNNLIDDDSLEVVWCGVRKGIFSSSHYDYYSEICDRMWHENVYDPCDKKIDRWIDACYQERFEVGSINYNCQTVDKINGRFGYKKLMLTRKLAKQILHFYDDTEKAWHEDDCSCYRLCTKSDLKAFLERNIGNWIYGRSE